VFGRAVGERPVPLVRQLLEALGVQLSRAHTQPVATRRRGQQVGLAKSPSQARNVHLDRLARACPSVLAPERDRETLGADGLVRVQQQHREQGARLGAGRRHRAGLVVHFK
jgi:hypothetical protein